MKSPRKSQSNFSPPRTTYRRKVAEWPRNSAPSLAVLDQSHYARLYRKFFESAFHNELLPLEEGERRTLVGQVFDKAPKAMKAYTTYCDLSNDVSKVAAS